MKVLNAFSLNMLPAGYAGSLVVKPLTTEQASVDACYAKEDGLLVSCVGHADTAALFSRALETTILPNRVTVTLLKGEWCLVGQYVGPRLPEGTTTLPEGARIDWFRITIGDLEPVRVIDRTGARIQELEAERLKLLEKVRVLEYAALSLLPGDDIAGGEYSKQE
jgi:hypothetical protein